MLGEKHTLFNDFPHHRETINQLKSNDASFAHLCDRYDQVDREVYDIEMGEIASSEAHLEECKVRRVQLKDALYQRILQADGTN